MWMSCLCSRTVMDCISRVLSCGSSASVLAVVCVKGMLVLISLHQQGSDPARGLHPGPGPGLRWQQLGGRDQGAQCSRYVARTRW